MRCCLFPRPFHCVLRRGPLRLVAVSLAVASLAFASSVAWPVAASRLQVSPIDALNPGKGEVIITGKVLVILEAENRLVISVTKVTSAAGVVTSLEKPVNKSVVLSSATSYFMFPDAAKKLVRSDIKAEAIVQAVGRTDGPGSPLFARVIALERDPDADQIDLWKLMPPAQKNAWWKLLVKAPAEAHASTEKDGSYKITVAVPGKLPSSVQIMQGGLKMQDGQNWRLHFRAKSDAARTIKLSAILGSGDYHSIGLRELVDLEPNWKNFDYTVTVDKAADDGRYQCPVISFGDKTGTVWILDMSLVEVKDDKSGTEGKE